MPIFQIINGPFLRRTPPNGNRRLERALPPIVQISLNRNVMSLLFDLFFLIRYNTILSIDQHIFFAIIDFFPVWGNPFVPQLISFFFLAQI